MIHKFALNSQKNDLKLFFNFRSTRRFRNSGSSFRHDSSPNSTNPRNQSLDFGRSRRNVEQRVQGTNLRCVPVLATFYPGVPDQRHPTPRDPGNDL